MKKPSPPKKPSKKPARPNAGVDKRTQMEQDLRKKQMLDTRDRLMPKPSGRKPSKPRPGGQLKKKSR